MGPVRRPAPHKRRPARLRTRCTCRGNELLCSVARQCRRPVPFASVLPRKTTKSTPSPRSSRAPERRPRMTSKPTRHARATGRHRQRMVSIPPSEATAPSEEILPPGAMASRSQPPRSPALPSTTSAWMTTWPRPASTTRTRRKPNPRPPPGFGRRAYLDDLSTPPTGGSLPPTERKSAFRALSPEDCLGRPLTLCDDLRQSERATYWQVLVGHRSAKRSSTVGVTALVTAARCVMPEP